LKEERGCLWYRILAVTYGEVGGVLAMVGGSIWWNNLISTHEGVGVVVEMWFDDNQAGGGGII